MPLTNRERAAAFGLIKEAKKRKRDKPTGVDTLAYRYWHNLDLWEGGPRTEGLVSEYETKEFDKSVATNLATNNKMV